MRKKWSKVCIASLSDMKIDNKILSYHDAYYFALEALREIDTHIRATSDPVPYIIETLKRTLPEYQ